VQWVAKKRLKSPRGRLFVALDLPVDVRAALAEWQREELTDPALRVVPAENLHITLVFLGWQVEKEFERIADVALGRDGPVPEAPEVELLPEPVGRPPRGRARLFAIEARAPAVEALQAEVSARLEGARFYKPEKRPFWSHLTVARVKPERRGGRKPAAVGTPPGPLGTPVRFRPTRLVVFRSHLHPRGARYEPMAELELPTGETER
jgi:RNA 2',3'-cyclic 3'-phosphodiesterase